MNRCHRCQILSDSIESPPNVGGIFAVDRGASPFYFCLFVCLFVRLFVRSFVCLFVCLFVSLFVCLFVCLWFVFFTSLSFRLGERL